MSFDKVANTFQTNGATLSSEPANIPWLMKWWRFLYRSVPRYKINIAFIIASALVLTVVRFLAEFVLVNVFHWPSAAKGDDLTLTAKTKYAAACLVSIFHSINLLPALVACFRTHRYSPSERWTAAPEWWRDVVTAALQFCTGYMIYDSIFNIIIHDIFFTPQKAVSSENLMFLGHHIATTLYMSSTQYLGAGHMSAMMCMLLGESTNPFHNAYYVAKEAQQLSCCNGPTSQALYRLARFLFSISYSAMRSFIGPVVCAHMTYDLVRNGRRNGIPLGWVVIWNVLIWAIIIGSIPWVQECWDMFCQHEYLPHSWKNVLSPADLKNEL